MGAARMMPGGTVIMPKYGELQQTLPRHRRILQSAKTDTLNGWKCFLLDEKNYQSFLDCMRPEARQYLSEELKDLDHYVLSDKDKVAVVCDEERWWVRDWKDADGRRDEEAD